MIYRMSLDDFYVMLEKNIEKLCGKKEAKRFTAMFDDAVYEFLKEKKDYQGSYELKGNITINSEW